MNVNYKISFKSYNKDNIEFIAVSLGKRGLGYHRTITNGIVQENCKEQMYYSSGLIKSYHFIHYIDRGRQIKT